jgi:hypothetical protein
LNTPQLFLNYRQFKHIPVFVSLSDPLAKITSGSGGRFFINHDNIHC